jgi:hypothetical protein
MRQYWKIWHSQTRHRWQDNATRERCGFNAARLKKDTDTHTLIILWHLLLLFRSTMVTQTLCNVTLYVFCLCLSSLQWELSNANLMFIGPCIVNIFWYMYNQLSKTLKIKIYRTVILPVVLYGCETWSLTLREERRLRMFENRVLRWVFGPKRDEVTGEWRKLHDEELRDLYFLPNIVRVVKSRRMRWAGHVARMGEGRGVRRVLVGKPEGKRSLGGPRHRWEGNIKMDLQEVGGGWDWME